MEQSFFDLDKLHKQQHRKTIRNSLTGLVVFLLLVGVGVSALTSQKKPTQHQATVTGNFSSADSTNQSANDSNGSLSTAPTTPATTPSPTTHTPSYNYSTPNYSLPSSSPTSSEPSGSTSIATPDPSKCPAIKAQEQAATASLVAQNQQLETQLTNEQNAGETAQSQATVNQITANTNQISSIEAPYITQLTENECSL